SRVDVEGAVRRGEEEFVGPDGGRGVDGGAPAGCDGAVGNPHPRPERGVGAGADTQVLWVRLEGDGVTKYALHERTSSPGLNGRSGNDAAPPDAPDDANDVGAGRVVVLLEVEGTEVVLHRDGLEEQALTTDGALLRPVDVVHQEHWLHDTADDPARVDRLEAERCAEECRVAELGDVSQGVRWSADRRWLQPSRRSPGA